MIDTIELRIQSFVQNWIADPLQWSGINLDWQIRIVCGIIGIGWVGIAWHDAVIKSWFGLALSGLIIPRYLAGLVYGMSGTEKLLRSSQRWDVYFWLLFLIVDLIVWITTGAVIGWWFVIEIGIILRWFLLRCKPKPPVGNLKFAQDSV